MSRKISGESGFPPWPHICANGQIKNDIDEALKIVGAGWGPAAQRGMVSGLA